MPRFLSKYIIDLDPVDLQLEDAEFATAAAVKARKGMELELEEVQLQLDTALKAKQDIDARCSQLSREKNDLQSHLEENEEDTNEIMKKYKALVQQVRRIMHDLYLILFIYQF